MKLHIKIVSRQNSASAVQGNKDISTTLKVSGKPLPHKVYKSVTSKISEVERILNQY